MTRRHWFVHFLRCSVGQRKGRMAVASLSVMLAAAIVVSALGVSAGIRQKLGGELKAYGANIIITPKGDFLDEAVLRDISSLQGIEAYSEQLFSAVTVRGAYVEMIGLQVDKVKDMGWKLRGDWPLQGEALLGVDLGEALSVEPGETLALGAAADAVSLRVAGLLERGGPEDSALMLNLREAQAITGNEGRLSSVLVRAEPGKLRSTAAALEAALPSASVKTLRQVAYAEEAFLGKIELLMLLVTIVVLVASGICVSSTMSATVLERMEEIGLMKALGGTRDEIRNFYLAEGVLIGIAGGLTGFLVGYVSAQAVSRAAFQSYINMPFHVLFISVGMGLLIAVSSSFLPVTEALRRRASDILRGE